MVDGEEDCVSRLAIIKGQPAERTHRNCQTNERGDSEQVIPDRIIQEELQIRRRGRTRRWTRL